MPPIPVPMAAAMPVPIRRGAMTTCLFCGKVHLGGRLFVLSLLL